MFTQFQLERPFSPNGGFAVTAAVPENLLKQFGSGLVSFLMEDGKFLAPGDAQHEHIRTHGKGAYSLWGSSIYFSASDNSDCNSNNRSYSVAVIGLSKDTELFTTISWRMAHDDETLLALIDQNSKLNKSLFLNFFGYFNYYTSVFKRHGISLPRSTLELGCGDRPYNALRFLVEGATRCVVNDVTPIDAVFSAPFIQHLRTLLELGKWGDGAKLDKVVSRRDGGNYALKGLEVYDRRPFEELDIEGGFDLIYSVSVLEHVMKPREVVAKMFDLLKPGGYLCHSIDLRDHADFSRPLNFLHLTEEQYADRKTENRLRASDWLQLFESMNLKRLECRYNSYKDARSLENDYSFEGAATVWVGDDMRATFASPYNKMDRNDLSVVGMSVLYRKDRE